MVEAAYIGMLGGGALCGTGVIIALGSVGNITLGGDVAKSAVTGFVGAGVGFLGGWLSRNSGEAYYDRTLQLEAEAGSEPTSE